MAAQGIAASTPRCKGLHADTPRLIALERSIVQLSDDYLELDGSILEFIEHQTELTRATINPVEKHASGQPLALVRQAARTLGVPLEIFLAPNTEVYRAVVASTPYLRSRLVFNTSEVDGPASPHRLHDVPKLILGTYIVNQLAWHAGMGSMNFQTVARIFDEHWSFISLIACLDDVMLLDSSRPINLLLKGESRRFQQSLIRVAAAMVPRRQRSELRPLGEIIEEYCGGTDRNEFVRLVGRRLLGRMERLGASSRHRATPSERFRAACQRLALDVMPDAVETLCQRSSNARDSS